MNIWKISNVIAFPIKLSVKKNERKLEMLK